MNEAIGQVLSLGVGVALSPVPIIAVVVMLTTPRARFNGPAFLLGWIAGLALAGTLVLLASSGADAFTDDGPATWVGVLKLLLGLLLLALALKQWLGRPKAGEEAALPKWMQTIDTFGPPKALAIGVLFSAVNPKNLLLTVGAAVAIAQTGIDAGQQMIALAVFVVVSTLGVGAPVVIYFVLAERSRRILDRLKSWMAAHNGVIMTVLLLVMGAKLLGDGIATL
jgi:threonine/homoserine/homoserine lactone efflux protein